jgi:putative SOS response-associated peptidase YedK
VTAAASADLSVLHHRVPVTLMADDFARWLDCSSDDAAPVMALLKGPLPGEFTWHEVSTRVNHADRDDAQLLLPITDEQRAAEAASKPKKAAPRKSAPPSVDDGQGSLF